jgi:hypothetical protein
MSSLKARLTLRTPEVWNNLKLGNKHSSTSDWFPIEVGERNIYICSPERLKSSLPRDNQREKAASIRMRMPLVA